MLQPPLPNNSALRAAESVVKGEEVGKESRIASVSGGRNIDLRYRGFVNK